MRARLVARLWWIVARNIFTLSTPASLISRVGLFEILGLNGRRHAKGVEAGHIMFGRGAFLRRAGKLTLWLFFGVIPLFLLLAVVPALLLLVCAVVLGGTLVLNRSHFYSGPRAGEISPVGHMSELPPVW